MHYALAFVIALLSPATQAKEYHEFDYWSGYKVGSTVSMKLEMEAQGAKITVELTRTVLETGAEKVVIETKTKVSVGGMAQPEGTEKEEILKDKDKDPIKVEKEGDEEIEVAGKKLKCRWIEGTQKETTKLKFWVSKDVPGGIVKGEASGGELPGPMKMVTTAWEKK